MVSPSGQAWSRGALGLFGRGGDGGIPTAVGWDGAWGIGHVDVLAVCVQERVVPLVQVARPWIPGSAFPVRRPS